MEYMLLIYDDEKKWPTMAEAQRNAVMTKYREFTESIVKSGHFRAGAQLQPIGTATTVREKGGKVLTTDGPYVETKEQLGGYYLVECKDLDEAIKLAAGIPSVAIGGAIEVRPVMKKT
jgi:hypothetical protein